jgi:branched-chain amino acid transport system permease protein
MTQAFPFRAALAARHRLHWAEFLPLAAVCAVPLAGDSYYALGTMVLIAIVFTVSLDLVVGYGGIVTLGHALFFGIGAYSAGLASAHGWGEPLSGLLIGAAPAALVGAALGWIMLRTTRLTLLMLSLSAVFLGSEIANKAAWLTGGVDGLNGIETWPLFGRFEFDLMGRTGYYYAAGVMLVVLAGARWLLHAPLGQSIMAIRDNPTRAAALGMPVLPRLVLIWTLSCGLAGLAGALQAEIDQFAGLKDIGFELSATTLVMLAIGGPGRLYGGVVGPAVYLVAQDAFAKDDPVAWQLWLGVLVVGIVLVLPGGLFGAIERLRARRGR